MSKPLNKTNDVPGWWGFKYPLVSVIARWRMREIKREMGVREKEICRHGEKGDIQRH